MQYSLLEAAEATGKHKTTIFKAIKSGKLSAEQNVHGEWKIDPAELQRVYDILLKPDEQKTLSNGSETAVAYAENALLKEQVSVLKDEVAKMWQMIEDTQKDRDQWRQQATHLLEDKRQQEQPAKRKGLIALLLGK
jgi:hypothetical protein